MAWGERASVQGVVVLASARANVGSQPVQPQRAHQGIGIGSARA